MEKTKQEVLDMEIINDKAYIKESFGIGKISRDENGICIMTTRAAMTITENTIRTIIDKKVTAKYPSYQKYEDLKAQFDNYFKCKMLYDMGIEDLTLTVLPDGTVQGLREGFTANVIRDVQEG